MICFIYRDCETGSLPNTRLVLDELGYDDVTLDDLRNVYYICHKISERAAYLAATGNKIFKHRNNLKEIKL